MKENTNMSNQDQNQKAQKAELTVVYEANGEKKIQNLTDKFCKEVDELANYKEKEIMEI